MAPDSFDFTSRASERKLPTYVIVSYKQQLTQYIVCVSERDTSWKQSLRMSNSANSVSFAILFPLAFIQLNDNEPSLAWYLFAVSARLV